MFEPGDKEMVEHEEEMKAYRKNNPDENRHTGTPLEFMSKMPTQEVFFKSELHNAKFRTVPNEGVFMKKDGKGEVTIPHDSGVFNESLLASPVEITKKEYYT